VPIDVCTQIEIAWPRADVAAFATDPDNATAWYENIKAVVWQSPRPLAVGARLEFVAQFLGRRLAYTWDDVGDGATRMTLRNRGEAAGFAKLSAPMVAAAMRRANRKDLERLREILERAVPSVS
jgi:hypothetical protein